MVLQGYWPFGDVQKQGKRLQVKIAPETSLPALFTMWVTTEVGGMVFKETGERNIKL